MAGLALVLMEVVSDFGTVEYFAVDTITLGIFNVWLGMNNMPLAAQLAVLSFSLILLLLWFERSSQSHRRVQNAGRGTAGVPLKRAEGIWVVLLPLVVFFRSCWVSAYLSAFCSVLSPKVSAGQCLQAHWLPLAIR